MNSKRILIADDDAGLVKILSVRLKQLGFTITATHDAMHALTLMHKSPADLMILDVNMPAGNGMAVCEMIKSDERLKHVPLLVVTGDSSSTIMERCSQLGVRHILKSPDLWDTLKSAVVELTATQTVISRVHTGHSLTK